METHFRFIGILLMGLAVVHVIFPRYFNWKEELKSLSLMNRQMMMVHTFFIAVMVFLIGLLCLTATTELSDTKLGKMVSLGLAFFWLLRLYFQLFVYSPELWRKKKFETTVHVAFTVFWGYLGFVFMAAVLK